MVAKHYANAEIVKLDTYITANRLRTILPEMLSIPAGISELPVEFNLTEAFVKELPQGISEDSMTVYGFVRPTSALNKRFGKALTEHHDSCHITISDWNDRFLFLCETGDKEIPAFVSPDEVKYLLTNCRYIVSSAEM